MHIAYITHTRFPTERAHGLQIASVCDALQKNGHTVELLKPNVLQDIFVPADQYYHLKHKLAERTVQHFNVYATKIIPYPLKFFFSMPVFRRALIKELRTVTADVLYIRSPGLLSAVLTSDIPAILELHTLPKRGIRTFVSQCNECKLVVCLTSPMKEELVSWGVHEHKVIVEGDGVNLDKMKHVTTTFDIRKEHNIASEVPVIGYTGQLKSMGMSKGVEVLLEAASVLQERNAAFHMIIAGGPEGAEKELKTLLGDETASHVTFLGARPHSDIPGILSQCDILVYPAPKSEHSFYVRDTSPLKLFEYMASAKPIVCADLPPLKDVVDDSAVWLFDPGDATGLADQIEHCLSDSELRQKRVDESLMRVQQFSWKDRMKRICSSLT